PGHLAGSLGCLVHLALARVTRVGVRVVDYLAALACVRFLRKHEEHAESHRTSLVLSRTCQPFRFLVLFLVLSAFVFQAIEGSWFPEALGCCKCTRRRIGTNKRICSPWDEAAAWIVGPILPFLPTVDLIHSGCHFPSLVSFSASL